MNPKQECGFTLIELSIVLVIIGLIAGGVLAGRDLIKAAAIRGTISQIASYNMAMNTYKIKFAQLPSDANNNGYMDGRLINQLEVNGAWRTLANAGLIPGDYPGLYDFDAGYDPARASPIAKLQSTARIVVYGGPVVSGSGACAQTTVSHATNYFEIHPIVDYSSPVLSPLDAFALDTKTDDGLPLTGSTQALGQIVCHNYNYWVLRPPTQGGGGSGSNVCVDTSVTPNAYNSSNSRGLCNLRIQASF